MTTQRTMTLWVVDIKSPDGVWWFPYAPLPQEMATHQYEQLKRDYPDRQFRLLSVRERAEKDIRLSKQLAVEVSK